MIRLSRRNIILGASAAVAVNAVPGVAQKARASDAHNRVWSANQTGYQLSIDAATEEYMVGDLIQIESVHSLDRFTKETTTALRQFVVIHPLKRGERIVNIYPSIWPSSLGEHAELIPTVDHPPKHGARIMKVRS